MPELPDLTVFAENLTKLVAGKKISSVTCHAERNCTSPDRLKEALVSGEIARVERSGKELCFLIGTHRLLVHLMLNGGFVMNSSPPSPIFTIAFADGSRLTLKDPKGLAKVALDPQQDSTGVDAPDVTADYLKQLFARKSRSLVKAVLIDQQLIRGIGNAYADEILWEARISPKSAVGKIPPEAVERLAAAIPAVLQNAVEQIGTGHPGIIAGEVRDFLAVHNPSRKKSPTGQQILVEVVSSKKTYFTDEQVLYL